MVDWMILTNALNDEWEAFSLFGIKFNNGSIVYQLVVYGVYFDDAKIWNLL